MNQTDLLREAPNESRGVFPTKAIDLLQFFKPCPRLGVNVMLDRDNRCLKQPKEPICSGCVCLGFRDVIEVKRKS